MIVGVVVYVRVVAIVPSLAVNVVVIGIIELCWACRTHIGVVWWHRPAEGRATMRGLESQIGGCAVDVAVGEQIDALQVDGHIYLVASVGIVAIQPNFVERGANLLGPNLVYKAVGRQLVLVAAVNHQLILIVQVSNSPCSLIVSKVENVVSGSAPCRHHQCQCQNYLFHGCWILLVCCS